MQRKTDKTKTSFVAQITRKLAKSITALSKIVHMHAGERRVTVRGQSSIEFLLAIPIIFLITIFIVGQFSTATKTTVAMATAKESFYEKTLDFNESVLVKKIEYTVCDQNTLKLNFNTIPNSLTSTSVDLDTIQTESIATSGFPDVNITVNETTPICP